MNNNIPKGYKKTEIGIIPEDWEMKRLGEIGLLKKGKSINKENISDRGVKYIFYGELYTTYKEVIKHALTFIPKNIAVQSIKLSKGDILFASSGETKEEIGKCSTFYSDEETYTGGDIIILSPEKECPIFLGYLLNSKFIQKQKTKYAQGDAVVHIYTHNLKSILLPLPPLPEQRAIARVLSDIDELIEQLDKLIEKKKALKKAVMQQLLTARKRLPGFSGKWVKKKLGEVAEIKKGEIITETEAKHGNVPVIAGGIRPTYFHNISNRKANTITISASGANAGYINYHTKPIFASDCSTIEESNNYEVKFIFYLLKWRQKEISKLQTGGAQPHVYPEQLKNIEIIIPPTLKEQQAIAGVLSDIDAEIEALEKKKAKYEAIKKGAMELLLTGKIRIKEHNGKIIKIS